MVRFFVDPGSEKAVIEYMSSVQDRAISGIKTGMKQGMIGLASYIVAQKLSGQVLQRRTGLLADAVLQSPRVSVTATEVRGSVAAIPKGQPNEGYWNEYGTQAVEDRIMQIHLTSDTYVFAKSKKAVPPKPFFFNSVDEYKATIYQFLQERLEENLK